MCWLFWMHITGDGMLDELLRKTEWQDGGGVGGLLMSVTARGGGRHMLIKEMDSVDGLSYLQSLL